MKRIKEDANANFPDEITISAYSFIVILIHLKKKMSKTEIHSEAVYEVKNLLVAPSKGLEYKLQTKLIPLH